MPTPANDRWANAINLGGASGFTGVGTYNNNGATSESGEPGHFTYNPGPQLPKANATLGPYNSVWFMWTCPATGPYFFSTLDKTGGMHTNFASSCNVFTGTAVNALTRVTTIMDQSVGDGWGSDNGASIAFDATNGATYYIQVDSRAANLTGNYVLTWGPWLSANFGSCGDNDLNFNQATICYGVVQVTDITADGYYTFGTFAATPGIFAVRFVNGIAVSAGFATNTACPCEMIIDGNFGPTWQRWQDPNQNSGSGLWASGQFAAGSVYTDGNDTAAVCVTNVPLFSPVLDDNPFGYGTFPGTYWDSVNTKPGGTFQGGLYGYNSIKNYSAGDYYALGALGPAPFIVALATVPTDKPGYDGGMFWSVLNTFDPPSTYCSEVQIPHHLGGNIGVINFGDGTGANSSSTNPTFQLVYYPFTISTLSAHDVISVSGSGTSWTCHLSISNSLATAWDQCTVALLNTGGISGASGPNTGVTINASGTTDPGAFTFTASPTAGLVTATLQISRNGAIVGTLTFPLYPVIVGSYIHVAQGEHNCTTFKIWGNTFQMTVAWPSTMFNFNSAWGNNFNYAYTLPSGPNLTDYGGLVCTVISSLSGNTNGTFQIEPGILGQATAVNVATQCTFTYNGQALPTFSQTINIPPA